MSGYKLMSDEQLAAYRRIANNWADCNGDEARLRDCLGRCVAHIDSQAKLIELNDQLLADRNRLLAMFDCQCHGPCVPYAMKQVATMRAENAELRTALTGMNGSFQKAKRERDEALAAIYEPRNALADLAAGATDMLNGWREIREKGGEQSIYGIGWDRAQQHVERALAASRATLKRMSDALDEKYGKGWDADEFMNHGV